METSLRWPSRDECLREITFADSFSRMGAVIGAWLLGATPDEEEWLHILGREWSGCDNIAAHIDQLLNDTPFGDLIGLGPMMPMMTDEERDAYANLPDVVEVYRGCYAPNKWGLSWTTDSSLALRFPFLNRYRHVGTPLLVRARAKKSQIAALKLDRAEAEIIVWRPSHISTAHIKGNPLED